MTSRSVMTGRMEEKHNWEDPEALQSCDGCWIKSLNRSIAWRIHWSWEMRYIIKIRRRRMMGGKLLHTHTHTCKFTFSMTADDVYRCVWKLHYAPDHHRTAWMSSLGYLKIFAKSKSDARNETIYWCVFIFETQGASHREHIYTRI